MTGIETAAALAAAGSAAGAGAAVAAPVAAGLAGTAAASTAGAITAAEAAALGLSAEAAGAAAAAGTTAAEVAGTAGAAEAGLLGTEAAATQGGLLGAEAVAPEALNASGYLAPEMGGQQAGLLANSEQAAPIIEQGSNAGLFDKANIATNGNLGQATDFLQAKSFGDSGPSNGKLIQQGTQTALQPQQQQPGPVAQAPQREQRPFRPTAGNSPYARQVPIRTTSFGQYLR